jgi:hypothetical protein
MSRIPLTLAEQHVDAVRAITREYARDDLASVAGTLTRRLREVTDDFLRAEPSGRTIWNASSRRRWHRKALPIKSKRDVLLSLSPCSHA